MISFKRAIIFFCLLIPVFLSLKNVFSDSMAFWYDPARDFLLAWDNLKKLSLIGQPTGIPGLFYGPYWIWMISLGLLISKDPRVVTIIILTLPYLVLFPLFLHKVFDSKKSDLWLVLWLLFYYSFADYLNSLWNPHPAPLLILILAYLYFNLDFKKLDLKKLFLAGICSGLIINFHFSFGLGILGASVIFIAISNNWKKIVFSLLTFISGAIFTFLPFIVFEIRHGFNQSQAFQKTFINAMFYNTPAVGVTGLSKPEIYHEVVKSITRLLNINLSDLVVLLIILIGFGFVVYKSKTSGIFTEKEKNLLVFIVISLVGVLLLYLTSKNPVWVYHFIGIEVFFLLLLGLLASKISLLRFVLYFWVVILTFGQIRNQINNKSIDPLSLSSIYTKKYIADKVYKDAENKPFTVFVYSPAIYTFDFDYIFKWFGQDKYHYFPDNEIKENNPVYLIIPKTDEETQSDFINYKTPNLIFKTVKSWPIPDSTLILKRIKNSPSQSAGDSH